MSGPWLPLAAVSALAALGAVASRRGSPRGSRRGSRDTEWVSLHRGTLRLPGQDRIRVKKLGAGTFATAYVTLDATPPVVYVFTPDDVYDKELLAMAKAAEPDNPHLPQVEKVGETPGQSVYAMPLYRAPLRKADSPSGWTEYLTLKACHDEVYEGWNPHRKTGKRGYQINEETYVCAANAGVSASTLEALRILIDTAANYGDEVVFEFASRNLATDGAGTLVLLDPLFDRQKLLAKRAAQQAAARQADRRKRDRAWR